jgi:hypothetical protein
MKYLLLFCVVATTFLITSHELDVRYERGLAEGRRTALHTNPVSEELEMVCAGLWVGEQAKKAQAKENAR